MAFESPDAIPGYHIVRELGHGGMATVYLAVQESLGREVALKLLSPRLSHDTDAAARFLREARTAARLVHRHIVGIHDVGVHQGQPYLSMEYLPGETVAGPMSPEQALRIARETALALDHAHREGIVHRDIKPDNILRRADGSCALADFGIARTVDDGAGMTQEGVTLGTPLYMSPEQLQGGAIDGRADLYSLGVVLFQLLTGQLPYKGTDGWSIGLQHINAALPKLPPPLARYQPLIDTLMAKDPAQRPQTGAQAASLIESLAAPAHPATQVFPVSSSKQAPAPSASPTARTSLRRYVPMAIGGVVALGLLGWAASQYAPGDRQDAAASSTQTPAKSESLSIAVLPLVNLSRNADNEYFSDGLAESMLDMLARVPNLTVIARTSSFAFKGKAMDVREIGRTLNAQYLLEGSVQQSGEQLRINVQLLRASDGARLWSQRYDRRLEDVFKVQDEVAGEVVKAMQGALPDAAGKRMRAGATTNVAAYQEYLRGNALLPLRKVDELRAALKHFEKAIELDPLYAKAYAGAAVAMILINTHAGLTQTELARRADHIRQALLLDPSLGEAYIARAGTLQGIDRNAAERDFKRGIELAPNYASGYQWYGEMLSNELARPLEAIPYLEKAIALDPLSPIIRNELGRVYLALGRVAEAERISEQVIAQFPDFPYGYALHSEVLRAKGDLVGVLRATDKRIAADPSSIRSRSTRCRELAEFGALDHARACALALSTSAEGALRASELLGQVSYLKGDFAQALVEMRRVPNKEPWLRAWIERLQGNHAGALEIQQRAWPSWFRQPLVAPDVAFPYDFVDVGTSLLGVGRDAQAHAVLRYGIAHTEQRQRDGLIGKGWSDVMSLGLMGDHAQACDRMERAEAAGFFLNFRALEKDPSLEALRQQPCFAPVFARMVERSNAQIDAASRAGLLPALPKARDAARATGKANDTLALASVKPTQVDSIRAQRPAASRAPTPSKRLLRKRLRSARAEAEPIQ